MSKESKIGALLVLMIVLLFIFAPSSETRDSRIFANQYRLIFKETPGLEENYDVKMAGVDIGYVKEIDFCTAEDKERFGPDANIAVTVATDFSARIPEDSSGNFGYVFRKWLLRAFAHSAFFFNFLRFGFGWLSF